MRHLPIVLCVSAATALGFASLSEAGTSPLAFTLDLTAPCGASGCSGVHPTDIALNLTSNSFTYQVDNTVNPAAYVAQMDLSSPVVCDEVTPTNASTAPTGAMRVAPNFSNAAPGGLLEFAGGGTSVVDLDALSYDGSAPPGVAGSYGNNATTAPQVVCYNINSIAGGPIALANGLSVFKDGFEQPVTGHVANEPWVSVQTVVSPQSAGRKSLQKSGGTTAGLTPSNALGFVVQVHNANNAIGWHLKLGYDYAFFDKAVNSGVSPQWAVLGGSIPQPGGLNGSATFYTTDTIHTIAAGDIQPGTNSVYVYAQYAPSTAGSSIWTSLTTDYYPAVAAIFPPYGTFPQRFDDKVAVASANNKPVLNVASIVGSNNPASTSNTLRNGDGVSVPGSLSYQNTVNANGATVVDPLVYFVDPNSNSTLPGTNASDAVSVLAVSCDDPQSILAAPIAPSNFTASTSAAGGLALSFGFAKQGALFVPGTATCTATFKAQGYAPALTTTETFTITMPQATATHFSVSAPASTTAGQAASVTITALDGGNNTVATYNGSVTLTSSDGNATISNPVALTNGTATAPVTFKSAGSQTVSANDSVNSISGTSGNVSVSAAAASHFRVAVPGTATVGSAFGIVVTALDPYNNTADSYAGTAHFTSTDGSATLPTDTTLTLGVGTPSVTLNAAGSWTVTVTDTNDGTITGTSGAITAQ